GPPLPPHALSLHQHANVLANAIRQHEPARVLPPLSQFERFIGGREVTYGSKELVVGRSGSEEKLRLPIEKKRRETIAFACALQVAEVDVRSQVLLARIREEIARDLMSRIRSGGAEVPHAPGKKLFL